MKIKRRSNICIGIAFIFSKLILVDAMQMLLYMFIDASRPLTMTTRERPYEQLTGGGFGFGMDPFVRERLAKKHTTSGGTKISAGAGVCNRSSEPVPALFARQSPWPVVHRS